MSATVCQIRCSRLTLRGFLAKLSGTAETPLIVCAKVVAVLWQPGTIQFLRNAQDEMTVLQIDFLYVEC